MEYNARPSGLKFRRKIKEKVQRHKTARDMNMLQVVLTDSECGALCSLCKS